MSYSRKLPISLVWKLLSRIFEDLNIDKLAKSLFSKSFVEPENIYELIYALILVLLNRTSPISEGFVDGMTDDIMHYDIDRTIEYNTLLECEVFGKSLDYVWLCPEHSVFIKALQICRDHSSNRFVRGSLKLLGQFESKWGINTQCLDFDIDSSLSILEDNYDCVEDCLTSRSLLNKNESIYLSLCKFSHIILMSESRDTSYDGLSELNYERADWYIVQSYALRQIWSCMKELGNKRHRKAYGTVIAHSKGGDMKPDGVYYFDDLLYRPIIVDVKLYAKSCVSDNVYKFEKNEYQLIAYKHGVANFMRTALPKAKRQYIRDTDINAWILHFRRSATDEELRFNGTILCEGFADIGIFTVTMEDDMEMKALDAQIKTFVDNYLLVK